MTACKENEKRKSRNEEVSTLVSQIRLEKNRYYMASIIDVVQFLCLNELAFRGGEFSCRRQHIKSKVRRLYTCF